MSTKKILMLLGTALLLAVLLAACGGKPEPTAAPTAAPVEEEATVEVPNLAAWEASPHNAVDTEPFRHWDDATANPDGVPVACARCHTSAGYQDFLGADGSAPDVVDNPVPAKDAQGIQCITCHNPVASNLNEVAFPGFELDKDGNPVPYVVKGFGDASRCLVCHQGRESKASVDAQITRFKVEDPDAVVAPIKDDQGKDVTFGFRNIHYYAAAATLYGTEVKGGYEYEGKTYDAKFRHVEGLDTCIGCHDPHTLEIKVETCAQCHEGVATVEDLKNVRMVSSASDYDGDGDVAEGVASEIAGLQEILLAQIQTYATDTAGAEIKYDAATYPYFMGADDEAYPNWTASLLKAAYNYQVSIKDPGQFAHGGKYIIELLHDSIEDLGGDVSSLAREDAGHFAGNTLPFRDWDDTGEVPYRCAKCHSATGLPEFIHSGGTVVVDGRGTTLTAGIGPQPSSNGFMCSTCHDDANWPNRYEIAQVTFPSGKSVSFAKDADGANVADDSNLCILCHQGRESTTSVNNALRGKEDDTADEAISFKNIHYLGAGATLFGADAAGAYQYAEKEYVGQNMHAAPTGAMNKCKDCHDVHTLEPKLEACATCHGTSDPEALRAPGDTIDYDGDGNVTEGTKGEIETLAEALYAEIQNYAEATAGTPILYDGHSNPYFFVDADKNGEADQDDKGDAVRYNAWTPRLLRAGFNYQYSQKDPGAFVHNPQYVIQFLIDSIEDLGGDVSKYTRPEVAAPAP